MIDIEYHKNSEYLNRWNLFSQCRPHLPNKFRIRIFNRIIDQVYYKWTNTILFLADHNKYDNTEYKTMITGLTYNHIKIALRANDKRDDGFFVNAYGGYFTNNYFTLCSIPHAKTLINSYNNNPQSTIAKLQNITNKTDVMELIDLARKLVNK